MEKKEKYNPIKISIIIGLGFVLFLVFGILYRRSNYTETWVVCEFPSVYDTYEETLKFRFKKDSLYGYYREEVFYREHATDLDTQYKYFQDIASDLEMNDNFSYNIKKYDDKLSVKTYIGVNALPDFFDNYMKEKKITNKFSPEEVKTKLESSNYVCKVSYK